MNISYYTAVSAMNAFQKDLDVTSNNMANISTNGYKSMRSSFNDLLYTQMDMRPQAQVGHGVRNDGPGTTFQQGNWILPYRAMRFSPSRPARTRKNRLIPGTAHSRYPPRMKAIT